MLRFLRNYFHAKRKLVFRFDDGSRMRSVDPIVVAHRLALHDRYLPRHLFLARDGDDEAIEIVGDAACKAFGVTPIDDRGCGLSLSDRVSLVLAFDYWIAALKKNTSRSFG